MRLISPSRSRQRFLGLAGVLAFLVSAVADAAPRVITDNRLRSLIGTPSLGRGYAQHSNSLKSVCFEKIKTGHPSFDFEYEIEEVTDQFLKELLADGPSASGHSFMRSLDGHIDSANRGGKPMRNLMAHTPSTPTTTR